MKKEIVNEIQKMSGKYAPYQIFTDWVCMTALSIQNSCYMIHDRVWKEREKQYLNIAGRYTKSELNSFCKMFGWLSEAYEENVSDMLGEVYMESGCGNKSTGQFFTPFHLSSLCADLGILLQNDQIKNENGVITINEPSSGGGGMVIAAIKELRDKGINYKTDVDVVAQDLDWNSVYMTYVQLSLLGIKAIVVQGDSLVEPYVKGYPRDRVFYTPVKMGLLI